MTERIRVSGFRPPIEFAARRDRVRPVGLMRPINTIGLLTTAAALISVLAWGTPHTLLFTRSSGFGGYRYFDDCAYASIDGRVVHLREMDISELMATKAMQNVHARAIQRLTSINTIKANLQFEELLRRRERERRNRGATEKPA